jgi:hypothetical protein
MRAQRRDSVVGASFVITNLRYRYEVQIIADTTLYYVPRICHISHGLVKQDEMFASLKLDLGVSQRLY